MFTFNSSLVVWINTMVASGRLGCCCVVGCPSNSINPLDPVNQNAIEERPEVSEARVAEIEDDSSIDESIA